MGFDKATILGLIDKLRGLNAAQLEQFKGALPVASLLLHGRKIEFGGKVLDLGTLLSDPKVLGAIPTLLGAVPAIQDLVAVYEAAPDASAPVTPPVVAPPAVAPPQPPAGPFAGWRKVGTGVPMVKHSWFANPDNPADDEAPPEKLAAIVAGSEGVPPESTIRLNWDPFPVDGTPNPLLHVRVGTHKSVCYVDRDTDEVKVTGDAVEQLYGTSYRNSKGCFPLIRLAPQDGPGDFAAYLEDPILKINSEEIKLPLVLGDKDRARG